MGEQKIGHGMFSPRVVKMAMAILGICIIGYIVGPPLYWKSLEAISYFSHYSSSPCPPCFCDCSSSYPILSLPEGLNHSFTDCMKHDPDVSDDMEKHFADLVAEELMQKESEAIEAQRSFEMASLEAKKFLSQYQKEADKCTSGMKTCEEARERAKEAFDAERKLTIMWEQRARQKGWNETVARRAREKK